MTMLRWEPLSRPSPVGRYIHRFFDDMFWANRTFSATNGGARTLALNIYEGADEVVVKAALPGVEPDDVQITVEDGRLAIRAKVPGDAGDEGGRWLRQELWSGEYARSVLLPPGLEHDRAQASYDHGVLTLRIPKAESARPKQIKISAKS